MNRPPAFQFYPKDWLSSKSVALMTLEQEGAYIHLLAHCWESEDCGLPDDDKQLAILSRMGERWFSESAAVKECFVGHPTRKGRLINSRLYRYRKELRGKQRERAASGRKGANSRWKTASKEYGSAIEEPMAKHGSSSSSSSSSSSAASLKREKRAVSTSSSPASGVLRLSLLPDDAFIAELKQDPAYQGLDIDREVGKLQAWLLTPKGAGKQLTRQRLVNWLNRADRPMVALSAQAVNRPSKVVL